jgi:hypothetical protein
MDDNKKCLKCKIQMEKGMLSGDSRHWLKDESFSGGLNKIANPGFGKPEVWAYRCSICKKIELISS